MLGTQGNKGVRASPAPGDAGPEKEDGWTIDSGANAWVTNNKDSAIIKKFHTTMPMETAAGISYPQRALIQTPLGDQDGFVLEGASRLMPANALLDSRFFQ